MKFPFKEFIKNISTEIKLTILEFIIWMFLCIAAIWSLNQASVYKAKYEQCEELTQELLFGVAIEE